MHAIRDIVVFIVGIAGIVTITAIFTDPGLKPCATLGGAEEMFGWCTPPAGRSWTN